MPDSLSLDPNTGIISGTPTSTTEDQLDIQIQDADHNIGFGGLILTVVAPAPVTFGVGRDPAGMAFDGTNMWVANATDNAVSELSPNGTTIGTFSVGSDPAVIAFDGTSMWVANEGDNTVTELSPNGTTIGTFSVGNGPDGLAFDGTNMWVANANDATVTELFPAKS